MEQVNSHTYTLYHQKAHGKGKPYNRNTAPRVGPLSFGNIKPSNGVVVTDAASNKKNGDDYLKVFEAVAKRDEEEEIKKRMKEKQRQDEMKDKLAEQIKEKNKMVMKSIEEKKLFDQTVMEEEKKNAEILKQNIEMAKKKQNDAREFYLNQINATQLNKKIEFEKLRQEELQILKQIEEEEKIAKLQDQTILKEQKAAYLKNTMDNIILRETQARARQDAMKEEQVLMLQRSEKLDLEESKKKLEARNINLVQGARQKAYIESMKKTTEQEQLNIERMAKQQLEYESAVKRDEEIRQRKIKEQADIRNKFLMEQLAARNSILKKQQEDSDKLAQEYAQNELLMKNRDEIERKNKLLKQKQYREELQIQADTKKANEIKNKEMSDNEKKINAKLLNLNK
jgi:hypothetical protein